MKTAKFKIMIKMRMKKQHLYNPKKMIPKKAKQYKIKKKIKQPRLKPKIPLI